MNERDSDAVAALLVAEGHELEPDEHRADVVIVNTCSVRQKAEDKAIGKLGLIAARKRERPDLLVGAIGCMVQRMGRELLDKLPGLDFAVGTGRLANTPAIIERAMADGTRVLDIEDGDGPRRETPLHMPGPVSAFVNILYGCDRRCTYCIVPETRGREWSRPGREVVSEVERLAADGVKEVTLLGQSVMAYGDKNEVWHSGNSSPLGLAEPFARLVEAVASVNGIERVRFTSGHPSGCSKELARCFEEIPEVCEHLHLPLQSASDRVLKMMRRGYTVDSYRGAVSAVRAGRPDLSLTTDVIVGFPSETDEDFEMTRAFMEDIGFDNAFVFKYSPRPGTPAEKLGDDVPAEEKLRRNKVLLEDQARRSAQRNRATEGRTVEVLAEGPGRGDSNKWRGRTRCNRIVIFEPSPGMEPGRLVRVKVHGSTSSTLYGDVDNE